ncbi:MAG: FtsW/RodA/SpoVE family cell cycle protein [Tidjanibacter sp.]|nr:FtsW/RodA/SpoVE family cell cycle protein [Tidjanibacter sp.]
MNSSEHTNPDKDRGSLLSRIFAGDKVLWVVIVLLLIFSVFMVYSTMSYTSGVRAGQELTKQFIMIAVGTIALFVTMMIPIERCRRLIKYLYLIALGLTLLMVVTHRGPNVSRSINLLGFDFQPFELLKITVVLMLADALATRQHSIDTTDLIPSLRWRDWKSKELRDKQFETLKKHTVPIFLPVVAACCVTLRTSNSTTFLILASCFIMLFIGRVRKQDLRRVVVLAVVFGSAALLLLGARKDTLKGRLGLYSPDVVSSELRVKGNDGRDYYKRPLNKDWHEGMDEKDKYAESDQTMYAKMSIATGRLIGKGPGQSTNRLLQEADKDMVYAFLIEEYGFLFGGLLILLAFLILFYRTMEIFKKCGTAYPGLTVLGLGMMIVLQAMIHMLVSVSLLPVTGQQLPIISRGGSSLVFMMISLGIILGISARTERNTLEKPKGETILER